MNYGNLNNDIEKLKCLLKESSFLLSIVKVEARKADTGDTYVNVRFDCKSYNDFRSKFEKNFYDEESFKEFIKSIELMNKINIMGFNYIKMTPNVIGQSLSFYLDDKDISPSKIEYIYNNDLIKFRQTLFNKLSNLKEELRNIWKFAADYNDIRGNNQIIIENLKEAKKSVKEFVGPYKVYTKGVKSSRMSRVCFETFTIDLNKIVKLIKEHNIDRLQKYMDTIYASILNGDNIIFDNNIDTNSMEDIYILKEFISAMLEKIPELKSTIESNTKLALEHNKKLNELVEIINSSSLYKIKSILEDLEILDNPEEKTFNNEELRRVFYSSYVPKKEIIIDYRKEVFKNLQLDQARILTSEEKFALNLYKTQLYRAFNRIIKYQRETGIEYDEKIQSYIDSSWEELKIQNEEYRRLEQLRPILRTTSSKLMIGDKHFDKYENGLPTKKEYSNLILTNLPHVLSAMNKVTLTEDIVVYRGTVGNKELTDSALLSTSLEKEKAKDFIAARTNGSSERGNLYKIVIPKGSPVICYTNELLFGEMDRNKPISEDQREILIDSSLYDFEYVGRINEYSDNQYISFETYIAKPKILNLEESKQK